MEPTPITPRSGAPIGLRGIKQLRADHLAFYARGEHLVSVPGAIRSRGVPPRYVGRRHEALTGGGAAFPATAEPHFVREGTAAAARLVQQCRHMRALWPADDHTAAACQVDYKPTNLIDGEHIAKD